MSDERIGYGIACRATGFTKEGANLVVHHSNVEETEPDEGELEVRVAHAVKSRKSSQSLLHGELGQLLREG